jgi:ferredoxin-type protein NapF
VSEPATEALSRRRLLALGLGGAPATAPRIEPSCLARSGVFCEACRDACEARALRFVARRGGPPLPAIDADLCTRCGECAGLCPAAAIVIPARG